MQKALKDLPVFDEAALRQAADGWKRIVQTAKPGYGKVVVEWNVGQGPFCQAFPMGLRHLAVNLTASTSHNTSDERWADYLEFEFVPKVLAALQADGFAVQPLCTDQRPIQVMRARRRALAAAALEKTGGVAHH